MQHSGKLPPFGAEGHAIAGLGWAEFVMVMPRIHPSGQDETKWQVSPDRTPLTGKSVYFGRSLRGIQQRGGNTPRVDTGRVVPVDNRIHTVL
jgi:hypothetical protein